MGRFGRAFVVVILAAMGQVVRNLHHMASPLDKVERLRAAIVHNSKCALLTGTDDGLVGSEDLVLGRNGVVFVTSGDLEAVFEHGVASASRGGIYAFNLHSVPAAQPIKVALVTAAGGEYGAGAEAGADRTLGFQPHGVYLSNSTDRLYVVVHRLGVSSVEIFAVRYRAENGADDDNGAGAGAAAGMGGKDLGLYERSGLPIPPVSLTHVRSVTSEHFPPGAINDVAEGNSADEIFVTRWQTFGFPLEGKKGRKTAYEVVTSKLSLLIGLLGPSVTQVFRCTPADGCADATGKLFAGANGITMSNDRNTMYVNDPPRKKITILERDATDGGWFSATSAIELPHMADNIALVPETGEIVMGTMIDLAKVLERMLGPDPQSVEVMGGIAIAKPPATKGGEWTVEDGVIHDGSMLSQISAAIVHGSRTILGSPFSKGLLVCDL